MDQQPITTELSKIDRLLHDTAFAAALAGEQEGSYYTTQGQPAPPFWEGSDKRLKKSYAAEKMAINLAGFYAVECGIGALTEQKGETPVHWLQQIVAKNLHPKDALLLHHFANATWKAGQPFRDLNRITAGNFTATAFLSAAAIQKDIDQVTAAANLLLHSLKDVSDASPSAQLDKINSLLKDKLFAFVMAQHTAAAYYAGQHKPAPPFLNAAEDTALIEKSAREEKIAMNMAGFYALECGISYLATTQNKLPSAIIKDIITDNLDPKEKSLFERFANATWKAGQPFRELDRITRDIFMPFDLLPPDQVQKDWVQIKTAAKKLSDALP
jgi:hypothetical protein